MIITYTHTEVELHLRGPIKHAHSDSWRVSYLENETSEFRPVKHAHLHHPTVTTPLIGSSLL